MEGIEVRFTNFWNVDVGDADVVFCYLFPDVMGRLAHKLEKELRPEPSSFPAIFPFQDGGPENYFTPNRLLMPILSISISFRRLVH